MVPVKVVYLSSVFTKGFCLPLFVLPWPLEYQVIPSQIFMRNVCVFLCVYVDSVVDFLLDQT